MAIVIRIYGVSVKVSYPDCLFACHFIWDARRSKVFPWVAGCSIYTTAVHVTGRFANTPPFRHEPVLETLAQCAGAKL